MKFWIKYSTELLEIVVIILYLMIYLNSIIIFPVNIILCIICFLFLPGYNLISIFKPNSNLIMKLGYSTILSLAIETIFMFFTYIIGYNEQFYPSLIAWVGFIFWPELLIFSLQMITIALILINGLLIKPKYRERSISTRTKTINGSFTMRSFSIIVGFFLSLLFLCISAYFSEVPNTEFVFVRHDYKFNFTFFERVPFFFFIFLGTTILSLAYIIFYIKNKYIILFSLSAFLYCLWILPYLQIGNYYGLDTYNLSLNYEEYSKYGFYARESYCITLFYWGSLRYSTSYFTAIILTLGASVEIGIALAFLYPLIFIFVPFFFYSIFQRFSEKKNDDNQVNLRILTIVILVSPLIIKFAHSATTIVIGLIIFSILVVELYDWIHKHDLKTKHILLVILLFFFLNLTHYEECAYFMLIIILYSVYHIFFSIKNSNIEDVELRKSLKRFLVRTSVLLCGLLLIFYFSQEFFGYIYYNIDLFKEIPYLNIISTFYVRSKLLLIPIMYGRYYTSLLFVGMIVLGVLVYYILSYLMYFKYFHKLDRLYEKIKGIYSKKILPLLKKIILFKYFPYILTGLLLGGVIFIDRFLYDVFKEEDILFIPEILLSWAFFIFFAYIFLRGFLCYDIQNKKQSFFLLSIIACSPIMILLMFLGGTSIGLSFSILNSKFITYTILFGLIFMQNNYFDEILKKNNKKVVIVVVLLIILYGAFYSLRKLRFG